VARDGGRAGLCPAVPRLERPHHLRCYAPNGASRILNKQDQIVRITNNYARMKLQLGPTLLSWLKDFAPLTYRSILEADQESMRHYSGHAPRWRRSITHHHAAC